MSGVEVSRGQLRFGGACAALLVAGSAMVASHFDASSPWLMLGLTAIQLAVGAAVAFYFAGKRQTIDDAYQMGYEAGFHKGERVKPKVTTDQLAQQYPTFITIDRAAFQLRFWQNLKLVKTYTIAVGQAGLETPAGEYTIDDKQVNPSWHVPDSDWAGDLAGQVIPPGPADPIKARWMGFYNGAGIHGTDEISSLGTAASHGCVRMSISDVEELYDQVPLGTPIYIGD